MLKLSDAFGKKQQTVLQKVRHFLRSWLVEYWVGLAIIVGVYASGISALAAIFKL